MHRPAVAIFDLDDTLAESFHAPSPAILAGLGRLLEHMPVAIITGASFARMESQFLTTLAAHPQSDRLYIFPTSSAQSYVHEHGAWKQVYNLALTEEERAHIKTEILKAVRDTEVLKGIPHYGEQMIDRESQVAYTQVGIDAPVEVKSGWDMDGSKRRTLWSTLKQSLPEFEILMGGATTIDITRKEVNKSHGVKWLSQHLGIPASEMLYVGDALYPGGNDSAVIPTGIQTRAVSGPAETQTVIDELLRVCGS